jgi:hypothetical protein
MLVVFHHLRTRSLQFLSYGLPQMIVGRIVSECCRISRCVNESSLLGSRYRKRLDNQCLAVMWQLNINIVSDH